MIESIVRNYLLSHLSQPVYIDVPPEPKPPYIVLERTAGGEREHIRNATIAIQSYGKRKYEAASLHESVLTEMKNLITLDVISACELNSEYDYTDTETKVYRYQAVYNIIYYGG